MPTLEAKSVRTSTPEAYAHSEGKVARTIEEHTASFLLASFPRAAVAAMGVR